MAKLIFENDAGQQLTISVDQSLITQLTGANKAAAWDEIVKILKMELIPEADKLMEVNNGQTI